MQILLGVVGTLFFLFYSALMVWIGYKIKNKSEPIKITEDKKREIAKMEEGFKNIMNYDMSVAIGKVVR